MTQTVRKESLTASLWRFLASIRLTVVLLSLLALTSVVGTIIPQGGESGDYIRKFGEVGYRLLYVFDLSDMYHSWWFRSLILLLTGNIVVCTWKRLPSVWKTLRSNKITVTRKAGNTSDFEVPRNPEDLKTEYETYISNRFRRCHTAPFENGFRIVAEKGRWARLGVVGVHLSIVILLAGALIGSLFGFDGYVNIAEGEGTNHIRLKNSGASVSLDFEIFCEDFNVTFYKTGAPREYRSRLHILEDGQTVMKKDIIVNDPLRYKGINLFQSSYGTLPPKELTLSFTHRDSGDVIRHNIAVGQQVKISGTDDTFYLREIRNNFRMRGRDVGETVIGVLKRGDGKSAEIILPMRFPTYDKMRKGEWIIAAEDHEHSYYTGLQVTRDPGVPLVYAGFVLLIVGCYVAFFMSHQKIAVEVVKSAHSSTVRVYGSARRQPVGFENKIQTIADELTRIKG